MFLFVHSFFFLFRIIKRIINIDKINKISSLWINHRELFSYFNLILIIFPIATIILNNSTIYTGWRHIFFIYPSIILLSSNLIYIIHKKFFKFKKIIFLNIFLILVITFNLFALYKYHPYQNIFFNSLFEKRANRLFEIDYWGLSNKKALQMIISYELNSKVCNLGLMDLNQSKRMLLEEDQSKIIIAGQNFNSCDYIIANNIFLTKPKFTKKYQLPEDFQLINTIEKGNIVINRIYKNQK